MSKHAVEDIVHLTTEGQKQYEPVEKKRKSLMCKIPLLRLGKRQIANVFPCDGAEGRTLHYIRVTTFRVTTLLLPATHSSTPGHRVNPVTKFNPSPLIPQITASRPPRIKGNYLREEMEIAEICRQDRFLAFSAPLPSHLTNG